MSRASSPQAMDIDGIAAGAGNEGQELTAEQSGAYSFFTFDVVLLMSPAVAVVTAEVPPPVIDDSSFSGSNAKLNEESEVLSQDMGE